MKGGNGTQISCLQHTPVQTDLPLPLATDGPRVAGSPSTSLLLSLLTMPIPHRHTLIVGKVSSDLTVSVV
jgi:hypothetical protein